MSRNKKLTVVGVVTLGLVVTLLGAITAVSRYFEFPFQDTAKLFGRQAALTTLYAGTLVYDPTLSVTKPVSFSDTTDPSAFMDCVRIEEYFQAPKMPQGAQLTRVDNAVIRRSRFGFSYQPFEEPRLAELRSRYRLDEVVANAGSELESMVLLRNWARSQFRRMDYQPKMENFDALAILTRRYRNVTGAPHNDTQFRPCHFFPLLYSQVLLSMGHNVRLVQIANPPDRNTTGHGMTEVWSNQYRKWVTMDADLNLHYEKDGIPLNLLEVHNERYANEPSRVTIVRGVHTAEDYDPTKVIDLQDMIRYHSYFQVIDLRNDWMTNHYFRGHPKRSDWASLQWVDEKLPPVLSLKQKTNVEDDFYWTLNQTEILVKRGSADNELQLRFRTFTPNFEAYELVVDSGTALRQVDSSHTWKFHPGSNRLEVRSVNKFGVKGIPSQVEIHLPESS